MNMKQRLIATAALTGFAALSAVSVSAIAAPAANDVYAGGARVGHVDAYTDGARIDRRDPYTDGARISNADPYLDGARVTDRRDPYTDGA